MTDVSIDILTYASPTRVVADGTSYADLHDGIGNDLSNTIKCQVQQQPDDSDQWISIIRGIMVWDLSSVPDGVILSAVGVTLKPLSVVDDLTGAQSIRLVTVAPNDPSSITQDDYTTFTVTALSDAILLSTFTNGVVATIPLNTAGMAYIQNLIGDSTVCVGIRIESDVNDDIPLWTLGNTDASFSLGEIVYTPTMDITYAAAPATGTINAPVLNYGFPARVSAVSPAGEPWGTIRAGAGTTLATEIALSQSSVPRTWLQLNRGILNFDLSDLPTGAKVTVATLKLACAVGVDSYLDSMAVVQVTPADATSIVAADYTQVSDTLISDIESLYSDIRVRAGDTYIIVDFLLNLTGIGLITGSSMSVGLRGLHDLDNDQPTWDASSSESSLTIDTAHTTLDISYTLDTTVVINPTGTGYGSPYRLDAGAGASWASVRGGVGTGIFASPLIIGLDAGTDPNTWQDIVRTIATFSLASVPLGATITGASVVFNTTSRVNELSAPQSVTVVSATPTDAANIAASDYNKLGTVAWSSPKSISALAATGNSIALNALGLAALVPGASITLGLRVESDRANSEPTWSSGGAADISINPTDVLSLEVAYDTAVVIESKSFYTPGADVSKRPYFAVRYTLG